MQLKVALEDVEVLDEGLKQFMDGDGQSRPSPRAAPLSWRRVSAAYLRPLVSQSASQRSELVAPASLSCLVSREGKSSPRYSVTVLVDLAELCRGGVGMLGLFHYFWLFCCSAAP